LENGCISRFYSAPAIVLETKRQHHWRMGTVRTRSSAPDLFSPTSAREPSAPSAKAPLNSPEPAAHSSPRHVLPANLPKAIKHLDDQQFDRLVSAVVAELRRRGRKLSMSDESPRKRRVEAVAAPLTQGKVNAVRAAFKAGITPSRIARQFGISQANVRKALASESKR
jgi:hypothetical protein